MPTKNRTRLVMGASAVAVLALVAAGGQASAVPHTASTFGRSGGATPQSLTADQLDSVSIDAPDDGWAVGSFDSDTRNGARIRHWDGESWKIVHNQGGAGVLYLDAVSALSPTNVWAAGLDTTFQHPVIEHWNGHKWAQVPSPTPGGTPALTSIDALSANDVWAVGYHDSQSASLIEHWDGTSWSQIPSPDPSLTSNVLNSVTAISPTDAWAVGTFTNDNGVVQSMIDHWDGTSWHRVGSPNPGGEAGTFLTGVTATSATDVWAVGSYGSAGTEVTLAEHWDGNIWTQVGTPDIGPKFATFYSVSAVSPSDAWAVGTYFHKSIIEHWNGTEWAAVSHPNPGAGRNTTLFSVSAQSANNAFAVGDFNFGRRSLIERWNGTSWSKSAAGDGQ